MKILGIVGSKRKKGNTAVLVEAALASAQEYGIESNIEYLGEYNFSGCTGCEGCKDTYKCIINDDMQKLYPLIEEADAVILGSPTYFYNISSDTKAFIERLYCYEIFDKDDRSIWMPLFEATGIKYAITIAVCEQDNENDMGFTSDAMKFPLESLGYRVIDSVKVLNLFTKGKAKNDDVSMDAVKKAGNKLAKTLLLRRDIQQK